MASKKVLGGFGYESGNFKIPKPMQKELSAEFGVPFTEQDFSEMEEALSVCLGHWNALRTAPSPSETYGRLAGIVKAANNLSELLNPPYVDEAGRPRDPKERALAEEAAGRIKFLATVDDEGRWDTEAMTGTMTSTLC